MLRAYCPSCDAEQNVRVSHYLDEAELRPSTDICCEECDYVVATFAGYVEIEEKTVAEPENR